MATSLSKSIALFNAVRLRRDNELLNWLSDGFIRQIFQLIPYSQPGLDRYSFSLKGAAQAKETLDALAECVNAWLDDIATSGAEQYTTHVTTILGYWETVPIGTHQFRFVPFHPVVQHIQTCHHAAWFERPERIRDLLESSEEPVKDIALRLLESMEDSPAWADLIRANLPLLRLILLTRTQRFVKKRVLRILIRVAATQPDAVLPLIEQCMDFYGFLALADEMMVAYARLKHAGTVGG